MRRLKTTEVAHVRTALMRKQNNTCPLCERKFSTKRVAALDHDHDTGYVRDVLCVNCNGKEGKIKNLVRRASGDLTDIQWLENLVKYLKKHETPQHGGVFHPTHKTEAEKRLERNAKARKRRAEAKKK